MSPHARYHGDDNLRVLVIAHGDLLAATEEVRIELCEQVKDHHSIHWTNKENSFTLTIH